jgi:hypothetical protein
MEEGDDLRVIMRLAVSSGVRGKLEASREAMTPALDASRAGMSG